MNESGHFQHSEYQNQLLSYYQGIVRSDRKKDTLRQTRRCSVGVGTAAAGKGRPLELSLSLEPRLPACVRSGKSGKGLRPAKSLLGSPVHGSVKEKCYGSPTSERTLPVIKLSEKRRAFLVPRRRSKKGSSSSSQDYSGRCGNMSTINASLCYNNREQASGFVMRGRPEITLYCKIFAPYAMTVNRMLTQGRAVSKFHKRIKTEGESRYCSQMDAETKN